MRKLTNIDVEEVSLVERPANKRKFLLVKEEEMDELKKALLDFLGEQPDEELSVSKQLTEEAAQAIKGALAVLKPYIEDFPEDVKEAIKTLAKYSVGYGYYPEPKSAEGETMDKEKSETTDKAMEKIVELEKSLTSLSESLKKTTDDITGKVGEIQQKLGQLEERVAEVEKFHGVKKSIEGQDQSVAATKWPSFFKGEGE